MLILAIFTVTIIYAVMVVYRKKQFADYVRSHFKYPPIDPLVGHIFRLPYSLPGLFEKLNDIIKTCGKNSAIVRPFYEVLLIISRPEDVEKILTNSNSKSARKADVYLHLKRWLGTGLLLSWGDEWFQRRKIITPTFHFNIMESFVEIMNKQSDIVVDKLKVNVGNGHFDIFKYIGKFSLDVICETSMGVAINAQSKPYDEYVHAVKEIGILFERRIVSLFGQWQFLYDFTPNGIYEKKLRTVLHGYTDRIIKQRRDQLLSEKSSEGRKTFLDMLLSSTMNGKPLSNNDIRDEVDTFMAAGHHTTGAGIAFTLYQLSRNKDIQDRLYDELTDAYGNVDTMKITFNNIANLQYLNMVVKEGLRILPTVPLIGRKLTEDTIIDGVNIPAGTDLLIAIYALHNDPDNFPDPEKFDPERFGPTQTNARHKFAYIPFSAGGRNCIGQKFALTEMKLAIAKLLMYYELLPAVEQKSLVLEGNILLKSANGICIRIIERNCK